MSFTKIAAAGIGSTETVTLHSLEVLNNATVGGVLTYEDVTNVDSIGIVTARAGVLVGSGITLSKDGDIFSTGISTFSDHIKFANSGDGIIFGNEGGSNRPSIFGNYTASTNNNIQFNTTGSQRLKIDTDGRVLIGGNSAVIASGDEFNEIVLTGKTRGAGITLQDVDANTRFQIRTDDAGGDPQTLMNASTNHPITIRTNNTERIRITGAGSVGIGTENPDQKLNVVDGIINVGAAVTSNDTRIQFTRKDTGIFSWVGIPNWSPSTFYIYGPKNTSPFNEVVVSYGSSEFNFFTGGTERMSIGANGHLTFQDGKRCAFSVKGSNMTRTNADNFKAQFNNDSSTGCFDSGNNFDTSAHEFEAPVNGYYFFHTTVRLDGWSSGYIRMGILSTSYNEGTSWWNIPSTGHIIKYSGSSDIDEMATSTTMYLPATHKAYVYFLIQNETSFTCMLGESSFSGHLIG